MQIRSKTRQDWSNGRRHCLRIQNLGSEFQQPKTKVPTRT